MYPYRIHCGQVGSGPAATKETDVSDDPLADDTGWLRLRGLDPAKEFFYLNEHEDANGWWVADAHYLGERFAVEVAPGPRFRYRGDPTDGTWWFQVAAGNGEHAGDGEGFTSFAAAQARAFATGIEHIDRARSHAEPAVRCPRCGGKGRVIGPALTPRGIRAHPALAGEGTCPICDGSGYTSAYMAWSVGARAGICAACEGDGREGGVRGGWCSPLSAGPCRVCRGTGVDLEWAR